MHARDHRFIPAASKSINGINSRIEHKVIKNEKLEADVTNYVFWFVLEQKLYPFVHSKSYFQVWVFSVSSPPPQPYWQNYYSPPLADMLSWAVWFKFLLNEVIANTCLFTLTSFSKQSTSWKVLEICELCALSIDSRKTYSVNKYMYTGSSSYSFDWGGGGGVGEIICWGGGGEETEKTPGFFRPTIWTSPILVVLFKNLKYPQVNLYVEMVKLKEEGVKLVWSSKKHNFQLRQHRWPYMAA